MANKNQVKHPKKQNSSPRVPVVFTYFLGALRGDKKQVRQPKKQKYSPRALRVPRGFLQIFLGDLRVLCG